MKANDSITVKDFTRTVRKPTSELTICGRRLRLVAGVEYVAGMPIEALGIKGYKEVTVSIYRRDGIAGPRSYAVAYVHNLTPQGAAEFLDAFNNRKVSLMGRKWGQY